MPDPTSHPPRSSGVSALRWVILTALVVGAFWLGAKALREAPNAGSGNADGDKGAPGGPPPATVIMSPVIQQEIRELRTVTGTLRALARAEVAAKEAGGVISVEIDEGQSVEKGKPLAVIDSRRIDAEIAEAVALHTAADSLVIQREAESKRATSDFTMKQDLFKERAVSQRELLDAERAKSVADAQEQAARDQLLALESQMELLTVRKEDLSISAPFKGRVVARHVEPGEWVNPGDPVATLVSTGKIEAWLSVPERFASSVGDDDLQVTVGGIGKTVTSTAIRKVADVDTRTRLFPVVAELDDLDGALVPGMSVRAELPVGEKVDRLGVPSDAIIETPTSTYVFRPGVPQGKNNTGLPPAEKVAVKVAFRRAGISWLEPGDLKLTDTVVVEGNERLFPGTSLIISKPDPKPEAAVSQE